MFETTAEGEQPSAAAEGALTSEATPADFSNGNGESTLKKKRLNPSEARTRLRKSRSGFRAFGASTRFRKSSSAGR